MEAKPHPPSTSNADPSPAADPPRRRPGAPKRKASSSASSSAPSKRLAKDRHSPFSLLPPFHNGPVTRARQSPNKLAAATAPLDHGRAPLAVPSGDGASDPKNPGDNSAAAAEDAEPEQEEPFVDLDFEAVRSRGSGVHVVPTHAGWFQWGKVHPLEERGMVSFFDGKTKGRTRDVYVGIRDAIVGKFHADPQAQLEAKDLEELPADGDLEARQEVLEFLDHWGLVNFHPFPPCDSSLDAKGPEGEGEAKDLSLLEKLYRFDVSQSRVKSGAPAKRAGSSAPVAQPRLLTELNSKIFEEAVRPEEPSVEYHCNACSADCSRKRYHCQKQADFDLCTECYNAEKFGQGMVASDFILMESAVQGGSGGSWTDQETILLLEALELFGPNWNEIAEHVATKTKAQCILHFIEMPIEDPFLEDSDDPGIVRPGSTNQTGASVNSDASNVPENANAKSSKNGELTTPSEDVTTKKGCELDDSNKSNTNVAMDALTRAFQAVGSVLEQEGSLSFAEAGNPVMALAAFIAGMVEPDSAIISSKSSLKAIYDDSPGIQLATRHCFTLEDPPNCSNGQLNNCKNSSASDSGLVQEENQAQINVGSEETKETVDADGNETQQTEKELPVSSKECLETPSTSEPGNSLVPEKNESSNVPCQKNESSDAPCQKHDSSDTVKECDTPDRRQHMSILSDENADAAIKVPKDIPSQGEGAVISPPGTSKETENEMEDKLKPEQGSKNADLSEEVRTSRNGNMVCSITSDDKDLNQTVTSHSGAGDEDLKVASDEVQKEVKNTSSDDVEKGSKTDDTGNQNDDVGKGSKADDTGNQNDDEGEGCKADDTGNQNDVKKIKHAAVTALAAAAVKAKVLARQEEDQIRQLASMVIGKQLHKLEIKLALLNDVDGVIMRVREQLDRARKKLIHERTQIIAARYGVPGSSSRAPQGSLPTRFAQAHGPAGPRQANPASEKPPTTKP